MHYLITGATGLIGSAFIHSLTENDHVTAVSRSPSKVDKLFTNVAASIHAIENVSELSDLNHIDVVINLAGEPIADKRWSASQKNKITQSRWLITQALVDKIQQSEQPPAVLISGSAIGYYGRQDTYEIDESYDQIHHEFTHQVCEKWENIALKAQSQDTRVCVLRTGIVLEKGKGALAKMALPFYFGAGATMGNGQQGMSWIHLQDMVRGIRFLVDNNNSQGEYNFTAPQPVSHKVFCHTLANTLKRPCWLNIPTMGMQLLLGEMADLLLYGQYVLPNRLVAEGYQFTFNDLSSALKDLYRN